MSKTLRGHKKHSILHRKNAHVKAINNGGMTRIESGTQMKKMVGSTTAHTVAFAHNLSSLNKIEFLCEKTKCISSASGDDGGLLIK